MTGELRCVKEKKIKDHDNYGILTKLYRNTLGDGDMNKDVHKKNIDFLQGFSKYREEAQRQIKDAIDRLNTFAHTILSTREAASRLDAARIQPLNIHLDDLKNTIKELEKYHKHFDRKLIESSQV
ncbi:unnamed protein product [Adineta ricciae]|uniref:Uncharacterized protein n=1 Tax=Adineta ricciae TaxID=249248 RepID=A0A816DBP9_ADIRI|nr:unnamed protein product [Adineta ricciae]CAF1635189.1 unnamed protein product [Adineta ricciae]